MSETVMQATGSSNAGEVHSLFALGQFAFGSESCNTTLDTGTFIPWHFRYVDLWHQ